MPSEKQLWKQILIVAAFTNVALAQTPELTCVFAADFAGRSADATQINISTPAMPAADKPVCPFLSSFGTSLDRRAWLLSVTQPALRQFATSLLARDGLIVEVAVSNAADRKTLELTGAALRKAPMASAQFRAGVMAAGAALLLGLVVLFSWGKPARLLFIGLDNRYSNSKVQTAVWLGCLIVAYLAFSYLRWHQAGNLGNISIPQNLLLLSGLSGLTFVGAKAITDRKNAEASAAGTPTKTSAPTPSLLDDLTTNDAGQFDLADFQMIVVTLIAAATYIYLVYVTLGDLDFRRQISLPDVDSTILAAFGLGQGAYLVKKAVGDIKS